MHEKNAKWKPPAIISVPAALMMGVWMLSWNDPPPTASAAHGDDRNGRRPTTASTDFKEHKRMQNDRRAAPDADTSPHRDVALMTSIEQASIDEQIVQQALEKVRFDDEGNVIVDHEALGTLYDSLGYGGLRLDDHQIEYIQELIPRGLPGEAGKQTAEIVGSFHRYLEAKRHVDEMYQYSASVAEQRLKTEDLRALRRLFFGEDRAAQLFSRQEANEDYMLANWALSTDSTLTEAERDRRRKILKETTLDPDFGIANWSIRRDGFLRQKQTILNTSMSAAEKSEQVNAIYQQQFTAEEAARIEHLNLNSVQ